MELLLNEMLGGDAPRVIRMRCPHCRHNSRLEPLGGNDLKVALKDGRQVGMGTRFCPDEACGQIIHVFYTLNILGPDSLILATPAEVLDFDTTDLPNAVITTLQEAATCYSTGCYVASAIMIRKTLEEICHDKGITGDTLKARIAQLAGSVIVPQELLDGLDSLRLLGNDAAHIDSQTFNQVGRDEVEVSFEVVKEFLKAVYQYGSLIDRLNAMKQAPASP